MSSLSAILFLAGFTVGCVLALVRHPIYGLLTYILTLYMDPAGQWWGHGSLADMRWELIPAAVTIVAMLLYHRAIPSPIFRSGAFRGFIVFVVWVVAQYAWTLDSQAQGQLLTIWGEFLLVAIMVCGCVDSWKNFQLVLWAHVLGCAYMGWVAYSLYRGGRFEGFGLGSLAEANVAALQLVTGLVTAAALFLGGGWRTKAILLPMIGLIADGLITTESRGGFLAALGAGVAFNIFTPKQFRARVVLASLLGVAGFLTLTTASYWNRINTIQYAGDNIPGVDTGGGRVAVFKAQWRIFQAHPFGCGYQCTEVLSPKYLSSKYLVRGLGRRASHNTYMSMLVDFGIPGGALYIVLLRWLYRKLRTLARRARDIGGFPAIVAPALIGVMLAISIADLFDQFLRLEVRVWFISLIIVYEQLLAVENTATTRFDSSAVKEIPQSM